MPRTIKRGDTYPPLTGTVSDVDGPVPIGSATAVKVFAKSGATIKTFVVTVVTPGAIRGDPNCGKWTYTWQTGDTDTVGTYATECQVTWSAGVIETFPNDDGANESIIVKQDLSD